MNFLVVVPYLINEGATGYEMPMGILYISSSLKREGFKIFTINMNHHKQPYAALQEKIRSDKIDVIMTGGTSPCFSFLRCIFDKAKAANPNIITICGGGIISGDAVSTMKAFADIDFGVIGEGEVTICKLAEALENKSNIAEVQGIIYKDGNDYIITEPREEVKDIDTFPSPDYEGFEYGKFLDKFTAVIYNDRMSIHDIESKFGAINYTRGATIIGSRSCPFSCTFCFHTSGKRFRQHSLDYIFNELEYLINTYAIGWVSFEEELFASSFKRVEEFCRRIKKYNIPWKVSMKVSHMSEDMVRIMADAGCVNMLIGIESPNKTILKSMRKKITLEQIESALRLMAKYNLGKSYGNLLFGDIAETLEIAEESLKWWREHWEHEMYLNVIQVLPGSYLYKYALENNIITDPVQFLIDGCPYVNVSKMSDLEMEYLKNKILCLKKFETRATIIIQESDYNSKTHTYNFDWECLLCGHKQKENDRNLFQAAKISCQNCHKDYIPVMPQKMVDIIENNIEKYIQETDNSVGVWGLNISTYFLFKRSKLAQNKQVFLIDDNKEYHNLKIFGKKVYPSEEIININLNSIIITATNYYNPIKERAKKLLGDDVDIKIIYDFTEDF